MALKTKKNNERGTAMIESALVIPVLAMLLFGVIQYGIILAAYITLRNASAVAARTAAIDGITSTQAAALAQESVRPMLDPLEVTATVTDVDIDIGGTTVTVKEVSVQYDVDLFFPIIVPSAVNGKYSITSTTRMR